MYSVDIYPCHWERLQCPFSGLKFELRERVSSRTQSLFVTCFHLACSYNKKSLDAPFLRNVYKLSTKVHGGISQSDLYNHAVRS
jgi:hypothetical protein